MKDLSDIYCLFAIIEPDIQLKTIMKMCLTANGEGDFLFNLPWSFFSVPNIRYQCAIPNLTIN